MAKVRVRVDENLGERQQNKFSKLEKIAAEIRKCNVCKVGKSGLAVPGEGNPNARIMFLGEAPGKTEAETGRPFVGRSGQLLRFLIRGIGLNEDEVYITSAVKYLPDKGTPTRIDILHGKIHLDKQISVIDPQLIVLLGAVASEALLSKRATIGKDHGKIIDYHDRKYFLMYHPAAALRFPPLKIELEKDFKTLQRLLTKL